MFYLFNRNLNFKNLISKKTWKKTLPTIIKLWIKHFLAQKNPLNALCSKARQIQINHISEKLRFLFVLIFCTKLLMVFSLTCYTVIKTFYKNTPIHHTPTQKNLKIISPQALKKLLRKLLGSRSNFRIILVWLIIQLYFN